MNKGRKLMMLMVTRIYLLSQFFAKIDKGKWAQSVKIPINMRIKVNRSKVKAQMQL